MKKSKRWRVAQYFEAQWWRNYLKNKDVDSYLTWKKKYWAGVLQQIETNVKPAEGMKILDAGCGPAGIFIALQPHEVTAIDPLLAQYAQDLTHFNPAMYPYVEFETIALENFERNGIFDLVFCLNAINHVSDLKTAFLQLYNSTKKGGKLIVSIDAHNYRLFKQLFRLQPADILHPHQYDLKEYGEMLTNLGCTIVQTVLLKREFLFNHYLLVARKD
ncbi:MAG: class I SAM-dependent methyltransferase [Bacteroidota bacterium]